MTRRSFPSAPVPALRTAACATRRQASAGFRGTALAALGLWAAATSVFGAPQDTALVTPEESITVAAEHAAPIALKESTLGAAEHAAPIAPKESAMGATERAVPIAPKESTMGVIADTLPMAPQEATMDASGHTAVAAAKKPPKAAPKENYSLREAVIAWDMLAKVAAVCPSPDANPADRLRELETAARTRLKQSAKAMHADLDDDAPPVLMTPKQAMQVVANAGGCGSPALAQWRARAEFIGDTARQVVAGQARSDRAWPRDAALNAPVRITVVGQQRSADGWTVMLNLANPGPSPVRVALVAPQLFVGLCNRVTAAGVLPTQGYVANAWTLVQSHGEVPIRLSLDASCSRQARANVGGAVVVDVGKGPRYWRFLLRGVGRAPNDEP